MVETAIKPISRKVARLVYGMQLRGLVARMYLFLFGEFDKDIVEAAVERLVECQIVEVFLKKEQTPMRLIYEKLIELEYFEDQKLNKDALLFIDLPDGLQIRIEPNVETPEA